jgi:hypothetical protein
MKKRIRPSQENIAYIDLEKPWYKIPSFEFLLKQEVQDSFWMGFDLDGTLAEKNVTIVGTGLIGVPIIEMMDVLKEALKTNRVKIFTGRIYPVLHVSLTGACVHVPVEKGLLQAKTEVSAIRNWCVKHLSFPLEITCVKDQKMGVFYDDQAIEVISKVGA